MVTKDLLIRWMRESGGKILPDPENLGVFTGYVTFTPERAKAALENNTKNRKLNESQIKILSAALIAGVWDPNVSKINFDEDMILSDGQHRLISFVKTGVTVRCLVSCGLKKTAQGVTDRRGKRNLANDFEIANIAGSKQVAALTRVHASRADGVSNSLIIAASHFSFDNYPDAVLYRHYLENETDIQKMKQAVSFAYERVRGLKVDKRILNVIAPQFEEVDIDDAHEFWTLLGNGVYASEDDPIRRLRILLVKNAEDPKRNLTRLSVAALIIKAWNYYESGTLCKTLRMRTGGAHPEKFPDIYNPYEGD